MKVLAIYLDSQTSNTLSSVISAARLLGNTDALVFGNTNPVLGVKTLIHYPHFQNITIEEAAITIQKYASEYSHILIHSDSIGDELVSYLSGSLNCPLITNVTNILSSNTFLTYEEGNLYEIKITSSTMIIGITGLHFLNRHTEKPKTIEIKDKPISQIKALSSPKAIMSIGYGASGSFSSLSSLAKQFNCDIYGSKPTIDQNYLPIDQLVGISGNKVKSPLLLAIGISGENYHMLGINASCIISINANPHANIFKFTDYGYIGKIEEILPLFEKHQLCVDIIP